jgi:hypothetical protein
MNVVIALVLMFLWMWPAIKVCRHMEATERWLAKREDSQH